MDRKKMALALADIHEYQKQVDQAEEALDGFSYGVPYSEGLIITEIELQEAATFEEKKEEARKKLEVSEASLKKAQEVFCNSLPKSVLQEMREDGKAVYASWTMQEQPFGTYGPFAAYFEDRKLVVESFTNFEHFKSSFEYKRRN